MLADSQIKVSIFLPSLNGGGAERVMVTLANAIAARGYDVDLVLASAVGPYLKDVASNVRVVDLKAGRVVRALLPLTRYLRKNKPAAMLSALGHANVVALFAAKMVDANTNMVVSERSTVSKAYETSQGFIQKVIFHAVKYIYKWAYGICAVSDAASRDLEQFASLPAGSVTTIYNPFDLNRIRNCAAEPIDHPWFVAGQPPVIVAMGRLNEAKDFGVLLNAFASLRKSRDVRLLILGEGELRDQLEQKVCDLTLTENVLLAGFVSNPYAFLARANLFVLSSRREGLPGALIEAMICGVPVVSTNCLSGPEEILENGRWGKLVPVGDVNALAKAMADVLDAPADQLPDVTKRANDFEQNKAVDAYLKLMGLPTFPAGRAAAKKVES